MTELYRSRKNCRICNSSDIELILDFGDLALTGVFLEDGSQVSKAPLRLVRCESCGLVQLEHTYLLDALYTDSYGYESHLNLSMRNHLKSKAQLLQMKYLGNRINPIIVDIASNDGTLLAGYSRTDATYIGIDPLINNISDYYPTGAIKVDDFFSSDAFRQVSLSQASLVTSLSVIYDLDNPVSFAKDVELILEEGGIWHFEQSYLPTMVETLSYDTICHEHLLYLRLSDIVKILEMAGLQILDVSLNATNGGSIAVTAIKSQSDITPDPFVGYLLHKEEVDGYVSGLRLREFATEAIEHSKSLQRILRDYKSSDFTIFGIGASTKGNVLLQWAGLDSSTIESIGDINPKKFGKQTPGSCIEIVSESEVLGAAASNVLVVVLPWHFRDGIVKNSMKYLENGGKLLFPLPRIEIVC